MSSPFIGRTQELDLVRRALPEAGAQGRFLAVSGGPGIGKTRFMAEIGRLAQARGLHVLWSQMIEEPAVPPYFAWLLLLRAAMQRCSDEVLAADFGSGAIDLADLVPELRDRLHLPAAGRRSDGGASRFQLFDAVTRFLLAAAKRQPLLLLFDNLHLADRSSVEMLEYYCQHIAGSPVAVICAYRDEELKQDESAQAALTRLSRNVGFERVELSGLLRDEVAALLQSRTGRPAPAAVVDAVFEQSDGNPLFVSEIGDELARRAQSAALADGGARFRVPESLSAVIATRLESLPAAAGRLLRIAAVLGRDFDAEALAALTCKSCIDVLRTLEPAEASGIVEAIGASRFRFRHALFREVPYALHGSARRIELHRRAAEYIEHRYGDDPGSHLLELAWHCFQAAHAGLQDKAVEYCRRAADEAVERRAFREAATLYEQALISASLRTVADKEQEFRLLLALGRAQARAGEIIAGSEPLMKAALLAHGRKWWRRLAEAILEFQAVRAMTNIKHVAAIPLLQSAIEHAGSSSVELHARLVAAQAVARHMAGDVDGSLTLFREGIVLARRCTDPVVLIQCLQALVWMVELPPSERATMMREAIDLARRIDRPDLLLDVMAYLPFPLCELGEIGVVRNVLAELNELIRVQRNPHHRNVVTGFETSVAILRGRWREAIRKANESLRQAPLQGVVGLEGRFGLQMFAIQRARGALPDVARLADRLIANADPSRIWLPGQVLLHCELGQLRRARAALARLKSLGDLPKDDMHLLSLVYLAESCVILQDTVRCRELFERLSPYRGWNISVGAAIMLGAASGFLASLAVVLRRYAEARKLFEDALEMNSRMGALPALARNCVDYAGLLLGTEREADESHSRQLMGQARPIAEALELKPVLATLERLEQNAAGGLLTARELDVLRLIARGASNKKVSGELNISHSTVATHVRNILRKIGASNRTEAAEYARRSDLLAAEPPLS
jgi:DNA-binding CsgD family transcriptional regulator